MFVLYRYGLIIPKGHKATALQKPAVGNVFGDDSDEVGLFYFVSTCLNISVSSESTFIEIEESSLVQVDT